MGETRVCSKDVHKTTSQEAHDKTTPRTKTLEMELYLRWIYDCLGVKAA